MVEHLKHLKHLNILICASVKHFEVLNRFKMKIIIFGSIIQENVHYLERPEKEQHTLPIWLQDLDVDKEREPQGALINKF